MLSGALPGLALVRRHVIGADTVEGSIFAGEPSDCAVQPISAAIDDTAASATNAHF